MKTPTLEEINRPRTEAEADAAIRRISTGEVRRCIPAQVDDDDVTLCAIVEEWKRLRGLLSSLAEVRQELEIATAEAVLWREREAAARAEAEGLRGALTEEQRLGSMLIAAALPSLDAVERLVSALRAMPARDPEGNPVAPPSPRTDREMGP